MAVMGSEYVGLGNHYLPILRSGPFVTVISLGLFMIVMLSGGAQTLFRHRQVWLLVAFIVLSGLAMAHGLISRNALTVMKAHVANFTWMAILVFFLKDWSRLKAFVLFMMGVHLFVVLVNLDLILSSDRTIYFRASYFFGDGNDFAWGLNVIMPLVLYFALSSQRPWLKAVAAVGAFMLIMAIIGTQSRGASLAMLAGFLYFFLFITRKKMRMVIMGLIALMALLPFVPETYFSRMSTVTTFQEDTSATGRLQAWSRALEMAADHPVLGVGAGSFNSAYGRFYRQPGDPARWISTHSVYFKVVAEYGFPGVLIILLVIYFGYRQNQQSAALLARTPVDKRTIDPGFPLFLNQALVAYAVSALFLGGIEYPHLYVLTAVFIAVNEIARREHAVVEEEEDTMTTKTRGRQPTAFPAPRRLS
jgi:probable O-glycosylation ligase (exosortase A-associated)